MKIQTKKAALLLFFVFTTLSTTVVAQKNQQIQAHIDSLNNAIIKIYDKDPDQAERLTNEALTLALESKYLFGEASARSNLGSIYYKKGNHTKAIEACFAALKIFDKDEKFKNTINYGLALTRLAGAFYFEKDYNRSIAYLHMGASVAQKIQDPELLARAYEQLGLSHSASQKFDSALYYYSLAKNNYKKVNLFSGIAHTENNTGALYFRKEDYKAAIAHYSEALTLYKKSNIYLSYSTGFYNIGNAYSRLKAYGKALPYLDSAQVYAQRFERLDQLLYLYSLKAKTYRALGNLDSSVAYFEKTIVLKDSTYNGTYKKELAALQTQSDVYKTETENQLLTKDKHIAVLYRNMAIVGILSLMVVLAFLLLSQRLRIQRRVKRQLEEEVAVRTKEIFRQKETIFHTNLRLKLALNGAQFDSQFAVNMLNTIQQVVLQQKPQEAEKHLTRLSQLMYYLLEKSPFERVPLKEELKMLEYYIQLEQLRLGHRFNYGIVVHVDDRTTIPALVLLPYVENAIRQGIEPAAGDNLQLYLQVETVTDALVVTITDNGTDRRIEKRNNSNPVNSKIGQEHLDLLTHLTHKNHLITIEDVQLDNENSSGTKIVLQLPIDG